jgi:signal transduction histidine kinase
MVEVVDRRDRIVARSLSLGGRVLPPGLARGSIATGRPHYGAVRFGDDRLRVYAAPLSSFAGPAGGGAVLVAASTSDVAHTIGALHAVTLIAAVVAAAVGALAVALLMRGALNPLARLAQAAGEIERTGDSSRRLPQPRRRDEIGRLAATLNAMLGSLERARDTERRFLADASHELRTPLTALRGDVAHLARHGATPELIDDIAAGAERLARLADDLLALSREEAASTPAAEVALDEIAHSAAAPDVDIAAEHVTVLGDAAALERALANLLENARTHGHGRIRVAVARRDGLAELSVEDEGTGVPESERERVFERFHGQGTGLGLAIVQATAARHGGRALVNGSRFTLELPAVRKASENHGTLQGEPREKGTP